MGRLLVITVLWSCIASAFGGLPFLFPSKYDTQGDVYNNVTGHLVPIDAIFPDCFCIDYTDPSQVPPPDSVMGSLHQCGVFILYTKEATASFTLMDIGFDGSVTGSVEDPQPKIHVFDDDGSSDIVFRPRRLQLIRRRADESGEADTRFSDGVNFLVENIPYDKTVEFEVVSSNGSRRFYIFRSRKEDKDVVATISRVTEPDPVDDVHEFRIDFDALLIPSRTKEEKQQLLDCRKNLDPHFVLDPSTDKTFINPGVWRVNCPTLEPHSFSRDRLDTIAKVKGAENYTITYTLLPFDPTNLIRPAITLKIFRDSSKHNSAVTVELLGGGAEAIIAADPEIHPEEMDDDVFPRDAVDRTRNYARSLSILVVVGVSTAFTTAIGGGIIISATETVPDVAPGSSLTGVSSLLNQAQKIYLFGQVALVGMPELCQTLSSVLEWSMLRIKLPWEDREETEDVRMHVARTLFWFSLVLICFFLVHILVLSIVLSTRTKVPGVLRIPRLELYLGYWAMPAIAAASASLFKRVDGFTDEYFRWNVILGTILLAIFPLSFVLFHIYTLYKFFYLRHPEDHKAANIIEAVGGTVFDDIGDEESARSGETSVSSSSSGPQRVLGCMASCKACCSGFFEKLLWTPLFGPPYEGRWCAPNGPSSMFLPRYGPMFDEFRGKPMCFRNGTYGIIRGGRSKIDRGRVFPTDLPGSSFVSSWEGSSVGHVLQISGKIIDMLKLVFIASLISSEREPDSMPQVIILLVLSIILLVAFRMFRIHITRRDLIMGMIEEAGDVITFSIALGIMLMDLNKTQLIYVAYAMIFTKTISFVTILFDTIRRCFQIIQSIYIALREKSGPNPRLLQYVIDIQVWNPPYLARKCYNRWLQNSLGRGVCVGPIRKGYAPMEEVVYFRIKRLFEKDGDLVKVVHRQREHRLRQRMQSSTPTPLHILMPDSYEHMNTHDSIFDGYSAENHRWMRDELQPRSTVMYNDYSR